MISHSVVQGILQMSLRSLTTFPWVNQKRGILGGPDLIRWAADTLLWALKKADTLGTVLGRAPGQGSESGALSAEHGPWLTESKRARTLMIQRQQTALFQQLHELGREPQASDETSAHGRFDFSLWDPEWGTYFHCAQIPDLQKLWDHERELDVTMFAIIH